MTALPNGALGASCDAFCEFMFSAARRLTGVAPGHPCARLHGHTFSARITVHGPIDPATGFVVDFAEIQRAWAPVEAQLDHRNLNDVPGLENPTTEHIARWIWNVLAPSVRSLVAVEVRESGASGVTFRG